MSEIHIHCPPVAEFRVDRMDCPFCKKRRWFLSVFKDWYGWDMTCLRCGDSWQDGEMCERPFKRAWRKESVKRTMSYLRRILASGMKPNVYYGEVGREQPE